VEWRDDYTDVDAAGDGDGRRLAKRGVSSPETSASIRSIADRSLLRRVLSRISSDGPVASIAHRTPKFRNGEKEARWNLSYRHKAPERVVAQILPASAS